MGVEYLRAQLTSVFTFFARKIILGYDPVIVSRTSK